MKITSAASLISLLDEPQIELKIFALQQLNKIVDEFWHEISDVIEKLEILHEDKSFAQYKLAGLLVSKLYFHLGSLEDSLTYALNADELFDINSRTEYVETILGKCIDCYTEQHRAIVDRSTGASPVNRKLENIINSLFRRCFEDGQYQQALGLALDSRRLDIFEYAITYSEKNLLAYAFEVTTNFIQNRAFRNQVLYFLIYSYQKLAKPDYVSMCQCLIFLNDPLKITGVLIDLIHGHNGEELLAYQLAFDLYETATQELLELITHAFLPSSEDSNGFSDDEEEFQHKLEKLRNILSGTISIEVYSQFLIRSNNTDRMILNKIKENSRKISSYTGTVIANGFMQSGTTDDNFLRVHSQWLGKMTNWAKTTAAASLGVIFRGQIKNSLKVFLSYVPTDYAGTTSEFTKCGILYGLGLIHANHGGDIIHFILKQLKISETEEERHGGCLGLGLAAMGTNRRDLYQELTFELHQDEACTGEGAGIGMGMIMLGSNNKRAIEEMVSYARESQHEKILRGLSVGIALLNYACLEYADTLINDLAASNDAILRRTAMYTMAMAYCGTGNTTIIRKFLHAAVSDVDNDVRRAAMIGLGFIMFKRPEEFPNIVSLLIKSFNPHVRYGAAMALGIACAGTGMAEALALLEPIIELDPENFVRQGAFIASAMILIQQNEESCPKVIFFRRSYANVISNRYESEVVKFGAILAQGIIDAGGRNVTISLKTRTGHTNMLAVVGTFLFTQYWYWFPLAHCLSLAFTPTCVIVLNSELEMVKLKFKSNAKPSLFAYFPLLESKKKVRIARIRTAILSAARRKEKKLKITDEILEIAEEQEKQNKMEIETKEKELNSTFEMLNNPARALKNQLPFITLNDTTRYVPVKDVSLGGIIMLKDLTPYNKRDLVDYVNLSSNFNAERAEPEPPKPFEWSED